MKLFIIQIIIILISLNVNAQDKYSPKLYPFSDGKKWGFVNEYREVVIETKYDSVYFPVNTGRYLVAVNNDKCALLDTTGRIITNFKYDEIIYNKDMPQDFIIVKNDGLHGFIDSTGKEICKIIYDKVYHFRKIKAPYGYRKKTYLKSKAACVNKDGKWGLINKKGNEILKIEFDYISFICENGTVRADINNKYCHINENGKILYTPKFQEVGFFYGHNRNIYSKARLGSKWGVINKKGKSTIPFEYDHISYKELDEKGIPIFECFKERNRLYINGKNGILNNYKHKAEIIVPVDNGKKRKRITYNKNAIKFVLVGDSVDIIVDKILKKEKNRIINIFDSICYYDVLRDNNEDEIILKTYKNDKVGLIDEHGNQIIDTNNDNIYRINRNCKKIIVITKSNNKAIFDLNNKIFITDFEYLYFRCCTIGNSNCKKYIYAIRQDGYKGFIKIDGKNLFPKKE